MEVTTTEKQELGLMQQGASLFLDVARFEHAQRVGKMLATSTMVPKQFQGETGVANCVIALNLAERMRVDPFMLMQNMYIVHGKPGIEAKLAIALMNGGGRFEPLQFEFSGEDDTRQCRAYAKELKSDKTLYGTWVTWKMAKAERWVDKDGSKWKTMPELMFTYRAAMFFARVYDPGALLGLRTKDELDDMVIDVTPTRTLKVDKATGEVQEGEDIYAAKPPADAPVTIPVGPETLDRDVMRREEWVNLRTKGFATYVYKNKSRIDTWPENLQAEMRAKWDKLYPDDKDVWPLSVAQVVPEEKPADAAPPFEPDPEPPEGNGGYKAEISARVKELGTGGSRILSNLLTQNNINMMGMSLEQGELLIRELDAALDAAGE